MMNKVLNLLLTVSREKIISVNALYKAGIKRVGGKNIPYIYKDPKASIIEAEIRNQLIPIDFSEYLDFFRKTKYFSITISFILKENVMRRDVQNLDKNVIDILTKYIHEDLGIDTFDDSLFLDVHLSKSIIPKAKSEYLAIQIRESTNNVRFDIIEQPEKIYYPEQDTLKKVKKKTKELGLKVKYYSDIEKISDCDSEMEFLRPEVNRESLGKDIVKLTEKLLRIRSYDSKFFWLGIYGNQEDWGKETYDYLTNSIDAIKSMIGACSRIKIGFINNPEEILEL